MALWVVVFSVISSAVLIFTTEYSKLFSFFPNFYVARCLLESSFLYWNSNIILTTQKRSPNYLLIEIILCICPIFLYAVYFLYLLFDQARNVMVKENLFCSLITFSISLGVFYLKKLTVMEKSYLNKINNLTLGYGGAIWYYHNYLSKILPSELMTVVTKYETKELVNIPHLLYILCPKSCKVKKYIDNTENIDYIEGSKDLPSMMRDHGGIKDREYRVSTYRIANNGEYFHCALEYAQPLKLLCTAKENGEISLLEMYIERETFMKNLSQMLKKKENLYKFCELVEYDDELEELHVVLASLASIQKYKKKTVEVSEKNIK